MSDLQPPYTQPGHDFGGYSPPPPRAVGDSLISAGGNLSRRALLVTAGTAAVIGALIGAGIVAIVGTTHTTTVQSGIDHNTEAAPTAKIDGSISAAAAKIGPSVVTINVDTSQEQDTGSGVIISSSGYILTNNHVISAASGTTAAISVTLKDGRTATAKVIGTDKSDDLAVVRIPLTGLTSASFGSSSSLIVGQTVVAVGAPLGLSDTVTSGIVSDIGRPVSTGDTTSDTAVFNAIQTDAAINPGNSGGPLVNLAGDVVGINAAIAADPSSGGLQVPGQSQSQPGNIGIGFAIPADEASRIAAELIATGKATHALMGLSVADAPSTGSAPSPGATVKTISGGGPAAKAGLQVGDIVTALGSERIDGGTALVAAVRSHAPGDTVTVTYRRGSQVRSTTVTLGSAPS